MPTVDHAPSTRAAVDLPAPRSELVLDDPGPPSEPYTWRRFAHESGIAAGILAVGLPLVLLATGSPAPDARPQAAAPPAAAPEVLPRAVPGRPVLVLSGGALDGSAVVDLLGQDGTALREQGAGWAAGGVSLTTLVAERDHDPEHDLVVLQGGEADVDLPPQRVERAALELADRLRARFSPSTALVFVGPVPGQGGADPRLLAVRDAVQRAAATKSVHFVDPLAAGWTAAADPAALAELVEPYLGG